MKKNHLRVCSLLIILSIIMSISAYASPRASDQLMGYFMNSTATGGGAITTTFSVSGVAKMARLGAESISIYEKINNRWMMAAYHNQDETNMTKSDTNFYSGAAHFTGHSGSEYKVVITIFAEDYSGGSDSRTQTFYVTA